MKSFRLAVSMAQDQFGYALWYGSFKCMRKAVVYDTLNAMLLWHKNRSLDVGVPPTNSYYNS